MTLSENIRAARLAKGWTQEQLAAAVGVTAQAVSKWETSDTIPDGGLLVTLADALGLSLDALFGRESAEQEEVLARIERMIAAVPREERFRMLREIGWTMEKALWNAEWEGSPAAGSVKDEDRLSSIEKAGLGFTYFDNRPESRYFFLAEEPEDGWESLGGSWEDLLPVFGALADADVRKAALWLSGKESGWLFEDRLLAAECEIAEERLPGVMEKLSRLHLTYREMTVIEGDPALYRKRSAGEWNLVMLLLTAKAYLPFDRYHLQASDELIRTRTAPEKPENV